MDLSSRDRAGAVLRRVMVDMGPQVRGLLPTGPQMKFFVRVNVHRG